MAYPCHHRGQPLGARAPLLDATIDRAQRGAHVTHVAKLGQRLRTRRGLGPSLTAQCLDALGEVKGQLVVDVTLEVGAQEAEVSSPGGGTSVAMHEGGESGSVRREPAWRS
jgi:hypothetical protein